ncbi:MAG: tail fiber protein [Flavipsychrobacter sp.]
MEGTIGEVRMVAYDFAPRAWAFCNGQLIAISSNTALFSIIGTIYGGDGRTTFALPDFRGRVPIQQGRGAGLPDYRLGEKGGQEHVTLNITQLPSHSHVMDSSTLSGHANFNANSDDGGNVDDPAGANMSLSASPMYGTTADATAGHSDGVIGGSLTMGNSGGSQSHENMQPWIAMHYVICEFGIFPSRN